VRRTRWREGLIAGAVVFAVVGGYVAGGFCAADDGATGAASTLARRRSWAVVWRVPRSVA